MPLFPFGQIGKVVFFWRERITVLAERLKRRNLLMERLFFKMISCQSSAFIPAIFGDKPAITTCHVRRFIPPFNVECIAPLLIRRGQPSTFVPFFFQALAQVLYRYNSSSRAHQSSLRSLSVRLLAEQHYQHRHLHYRLCEESHAQGRLFHQESFYRTLFREGATPEFLPAPEPSHMSPGILDRLPGRVWFDYL